MAKRQCKLILTSTTRSKLEEVKKNCLECSNGTLTSDDILVLAYDISDYSKNDDAFKQIVEKFGDIDILACNAGKISNSVVVEEKFDDVRKTFDINLFSHVYITKLVLKHWLAIKARDGEKTLNKQILVTSSVAVIVQVPFFSSYTATKLSLNAFFHDVAMQHQKKDGIYVTIALPGPVDTPIADKRILQDRKQNTATMKRMKAKRCAHLMLVSLANKMHVTWISNQPSLLMTYIYDSYSYSMIYLFRLFGVESFKKIFFE